MSQGRENTGAASAENPPPHLWDDTPVEGAPRPERPWAGALGMGSFHSVCCPLSGAQCSRKLPPRLLQAPGEQREVAGRPPRVLTLRETFPASWGPGPAQMVPLPPQGLAFPRSPACPEGT